MVFIVDKTKQAITKNTYVKIGADLFFIIASNNEKVYLLYFVQIPYQLGIDILRAYPKIVLL